MNLNPTIAASLRGYVPSTWTDNPAADAESHYDSLDTFTTTVTYLGIEFDVDVNKHSLRCKEIFGPGGDDWFYEFSENARNNIARIAIHQSNV